MGDPQKQEVQNCSLILDDLGYPAISGNLHFLRLHMSAYMLYELYILIISYNSNLYTHTHTYHGGSNCS